MLHYVPDPVAIPDPVVADVLFVGGDYTLHPDTDLVTFNMSSPFVSFHFKFTAESLWSYPVYQTTHADTVQRLLSPEYLPGSVHYTTTDWRTDAGPEILGHIVFWLQKGINIEIDLSALRKQAIQ